MFIGILLSIISFLPPVNYEMSLAGNFGEPRAHHFHGGIDIKTERVENKPVFSVGSGYVSRVVIGKYGKASRGIHQHVLPFECFLSED